MLQQLTSSFKESGGLQGEGKPDPIDIPGLPPPLLVLHGFGSTPREMDLVAEVGAELGLRVRGPLLPGHGSHADDLARTSFADWYAAAETEFLQLSKLGPVNVIGLSMGSVIAMHLAAKHRARMCSLGLLSNATHLYSPYPAWPLAWVQQLGIPDFAVPKLDGPDIADPDGKRTHLTYTAQPVYAANSLQIAGRQALRLLPKISCPTFIAHGQHDHVAPVQNAWEVADRLGTGDVEVHILPDSNHIVTKDVNAGLLKQQLTAFLTRVTGRGN